MESRECVRSSPARAVATGAVAFVCLSCGGGDLVEPDTGDIVVRTTTAGVPAGAAGYTVSVDDGEPRTIGPNEAITVAGVESGLHTVELAAVPEGCTLAGDNPRTVTVTGGGSVEVTFAVACPPPPGAVTVTISTTGTFPDPDGYSLQADRAPELPVEVNATVVLTDFSPGPHLLQLNGVAPNCTVTGENPRTIDVPASAALTVEFMITCPLATLRFTEMASRTRADLPDVWGADANNVFVVGQIDESDGGTASVVLRYDGTVWTQQLRQQNLVLRAIWGSSATDVYAVGFPPFATGAVLIHYDGNQWAPIRNFLSNVEEFAFESIWGSSATDIFAVGSAFDGLFGQALLVHYDGTEWRRMLPPESTSPSLNDVWGSGPTDVYAIGRDEVPSPAEGVILRYDGAAWSPVVQEGGLLLNGIWGSSATDVFAVGFDVSEEFEVSSAVLHFDGLAWSRLQVPSVGVLFEVWGSAPDDVYVVGEEGRLLHYDGAIWTQTRPSRQSLLGVWGSSAADVFLVGNRGTILHGVP